MNLTGFKFINGNVNYTKNELFSHYLSAGPVFGKI